MMITNTSKEIARQKGKVNHMEDRLSNLSDEILTKILSYLKTKEAVRTGVLSTRWKSVWESVPTLKLCKSDFRVERESYSITKTETRFLNFMDRVLIARKLPSFEKVSIECSDIDPIRIISWLRAALERNVSELDVNFSVCSVAPPCELTPSLFSYNKLVVLKLCVDVALYFPTASSCFPNLKVLELEDILYKDDDSLPNLLSSCSVLEDLVIIRSTLNELGTLNLTSRSLKRLKVYSISENVDERVDLKMVINAPAVESLDISCVTTKEYVVKDLSSIVEAKLDLFHLCSLSSDTSENYMLCLIEFLRGMSNVKFLTLGFTTMQSFCFADSYNLSMFHNLTRLEIEGSNDIREDRSDLWDWKLMLEILKRSPLLEILILRAFAFSPEECCNALTWDVPNCLVTHLKTIEIDYCSDGDMEKVRYFLINARVLEKMTIRSLHSNKNFKLDLCCVILESARGSVTSSNRETVTWSDTETVISFL